MNWARQPWLVAAAERPPAGNSEELLLEEYHRRTAWRYLEQKHPGAKFHSFVRIEDYQGDMRGYVAATIE